MGAGTTERHDTRSGVAYTSAADRLMSLPDVFSVAELSLIEGFTDRRIASQYLWRWKTGAKVLPLGPRAGVFINLVRNPQGATDAALWERALLKAMPSSTVAGYEVLAESGLSTQVTHSRYIIVSEKDSLRAVDGAQVSSRPVRWFKEIIVQGGLVSGATAGSGSLLPRLTPGAALADLVLYGDSCPDVDDVDLEELDADQCALFLQLVGSAQGVNVDELPRSTTIIEAVVDRVDRGEGSSRRTTIRDRLA